MPEYTIAKLTLQYQGRDYSIEYDSGEGYPEEAVRYMFFEGNYSCDCNKSLFIQQQCDMAFPMLPCGDEIKITQFAVDYQVEEPLVGNSERPGRRIEGTTPQVVEPTEELVEEPVAGVAEKPEPTPAPAPGIPRTGY